MRAIWPQQGGSIIEACRQYGLQHEGSMIAAWPQYSWQWKVVSTFKNFPTLCQFYCMYMCPSMFAVQLHFNMAASTTDRSLSNFEIMWFINVYIFRKQTPLSAKIHRSPTGAPILYTAFMLPYDLFSGCKIYCLHAANLYGFLEAGNILISCCLYICCHFSSGSM